MKSIKDILNYLIEAADDKVKEKTTYKRFGHTFNKDAKLIIARGPNNVADITFAIEKENVYVKEMVGGRVKQTKKQVVTSYQKDVKDWEGRPTSVTRQKKEDVFKSYKLTDQETSKAASLIAGFIKKIDPTEVRIFNINQYNAENGEYSHNHAQIEKVIKAVKDTFVSGSDSEDGYTVKDTGKQNNKTVLVHKSVSKGKEKAEGESDTPKRKRVPTEFVKTKENIGVKRLFKVEKDEDGNEVKRYTKLFPKDARYRKLVHTFKRKNGVTIEVYDYRTREGAGYKTWAETQGENEKKDMSFARNMDANKAKSLRYKYEELKKNIKAMAMAQLQREMTGDKSEFPKEALDLVSSTVDLSIGNFSVYTDWADYAEEDKQAEVKKAVDAVKFKYSSFFKKPLGKAPPQKTVLVKGGATKEKPKAEDTTPTKYKELIDVLVKRDNLSRAEALKRVVDVRSEVIKHINRNEYFKAESVFERALGLEVDYMYDIL